MQLRAQTRQSCNSSHCQKIHLSLWFCVCSQDLDSDLKNKYSTVEQLIGQKATSVADAKKRAESLQQEAKELLLQASDKLQLLKGDITLYTVMHTDCVYMQSGNQITQKKLVSQVIGEQVYLTKKIWLLEIHAYM